MRMHWANTRVIQPCRNAMWLYNLPICRLHHEAFAAMQHSGLTQLRSGCAHTTVNAMSCRFYSYNLYTIFIQKMVESTCRIAASTYTSYYMGRQFTAGFLF